MSTFEKSQSYMWTSPLTTAQSEEFDNDDDHDNSNASSFTPLVVFYVVLMALIVLGNTLVVLAILLYRSMWTVTNFFIFSCACADLLVGFFVIPATISVHVGSTNEVGVFQCEILPYAQLLSVTASIISMAVICLERYNCIVATQSKKWNNVKAFRVVLLIWFLSGLYAARMFIQEKIAKDHMWEKRERPLAGAGTTEAAVEQNDEINDFFCSLFVEDDISDVYFRLLDMLVIFIIPMVIMVVLYTKIIIKLQETNMASSSSSTARKRRIVRMFIIVMACFFICWLPWHLTDIINDLMEVISGDRLETSAEDDDKAAPQQRMSPAHITTIIALSNSCMSPIIYFIFSSLFRHRMMNLLKCSCLFRRAKVQPTAGATGMDCKTTASNLNNVSG